MVRFVFCVCYGVGGVEAGGSLVLRGEAERRRGRGRHTTLLCVCSIVCCGGMFSFLL